MPCLVKCMFEHLPTRVFSQFLFHVTGLIAAASGQLDAVLQNYGHENKLLPNGISNGKPSVKTYQNGNAIKSSNGSLNGVYSNGNGNGVHH